MTLVADRPPPVSAATQADPGAMPAAPAPAVPRPAVPSLAVPHLDVPILQHPARGLARGQLLLVHGAFAGAAIWSRHWQPWVAEDGWSSLAPSLPRRDGQGARVGIRAWVTALEAVVARHCDPALPLVVIAHSMGALAAARLLGRVPMAALVLLAPAPPDGMGSAVLRLSLLDAPLMLGLMQVGMSEAPPPPGLTARSLFSAAADRDDIAYAETTAVRESPRLLMEAVLPHGIPSARAARVPCLVVGGTGDRLMPPDAVWRTAAHHGAELRMLDDLAHGLMLDRGWSRAAGVVAGWLDRVPGLSP